MLHAFPGSKTGINKPNKGEWKRGYKRVVVVGVLENRTAI